MIPRKEAKRLLEELAERLDAIVTDEGRVIPWYVREMSPKLLADSDLVLRGSENVEQKARRYLTEGRLTIKKAETADGAIVAECRGSEGEVYKLGYDPRGGGEWRCTCPVLGKRRCAHLVALRLVVSPRPSIGGHR